MATAKTKTAAPRTINREATEQVAARLTRQEKRDLDALVEAHDAAAEAQGFKGGGFNGWLRSIIREKRGAT